ncbi:MAG: tetratricopeptide repeat protein [Gammaproteobacteria bacterium]|jgi:TPR repeat protein
MRKSAIISLTLLLSAIPIYPVSASYEDGLKAAEKDDYKTAFKQWQALARKGDVQTQATVAVLYHTGQGVSRDYEKAFYWYKKAAEQGNTASQANLGVMYAKGTGTKRDMVESFAWYTLAAKAHKDKKIGNELWGIDAIAAQLSKQEMAKAKKLANQYLKKYAAKK